MTMRRTIDKNTITLWPAVGVDKKTTFNNNSINTKFSYILMKRMTR